MFRWQQQARHQSNAGANLEDQLESLLKIMKAQTDFSEAATTTQIAAVLTLRPAIIAIDGPAGAGKSTVGYHLAQILDFLFFDTGIMYRAVTWTAFQQNLDIYEAETMGALAQRMKIDITVSDEPSQQCLVHVDGQDVTPYLRTLDVDQNVSIVSAHAHVRQALSMQQRRIGEHYGSGNADKRGIVMAGRDIGTVVLPQAKVKIFMEATLVERARRRFCEVRKKGRKAQITQIIEEIKQRDKIDSERSLSPLRRADDALELDTSNMTTEEVVYEILAIAAEQAEQS